MCVLVTCTGTCTLAPLSNPTTVNVAYTIVLTPNNILFPVPTSDKVCSYYC